MKLGKLNCKVFILIKQYISGETAPRPAKAILRCTGVHFALQDSAV